MKTLKIVWDKKAIAQFAEAIEYIRKDSLTNAIRVRDDIAEIIIRFLNIQKDSRLIKIRLTIQKTNTELLKSIV